MGRSELNMMYSSGERAEHSGTPVCKKIGNELALLIVMYAMRFMRKL